MIKSVALSKRALKELHKVPRRMSTRKRSKAAKALETIVGKSLSFGTLLESIRLGEEMSQVEFAKKLGISRSHLCDIEKGRKSVSVARAARFAPGLDDLH